MYTFPILIQARQRQCVYVCACVCVHVCMCLHMCVCMCVYVCVCVCVFNQPDINISYFDSGKTEAVCVYICVCVSVCVCVCAYMHVLAYVCLCMCVCVCVQPTWHQHLVHLVTFHKQKLQTARQHTETVYLDISRHCQGLHIVSCQ